MKIISYNCVALLLISLSEPKNFHKRSVFDIIPSIDINNVSGKYIVRYNKFGISHLWSSWIFLESRILFKSFGYIIIFLIPGAAGTKCQCSNGAHKCIFDEQVSYRPIRAQYETVFNWPIRAQYETNWPITDSQLSMRLTDQSRFSKRLTDQSQLSLILTGILSFGGQET